MGVSQYEEGLNNMSFEGVKRHVVSRRRSHVRRPKRIVMKKRSLGGGSRKTSSYGIVRRVKTLKRLIPSPKSDSQGLDGLFRDTADYILSLQMRVRVMQIMVNVLSGSEE